MKIRNRIFSFILLPAVLLYGSATLVGMNLLIRSYEETTIASKQEDLETLASGVNTWIVARISELTNLSWIPLFQEENFPDQLEYLTTWHAKFAFNYTDLYLIENDFSWFSTGGETGRITSQFLRRYFFGDEYHPYFIGIDGNFNHDEKVILILRPVYAADDTILRYIGGTITVDRLSDIFGYLTFSQFQGYMLVNPRGEIVLHSDSSQIGKREIELYGREFSTLIEQEEEIYYFTSVLRTNWKIVAFIDRATLLEAQYISNRFMLTISLFMFAIITFLIYVITGLFTRPVQEMTRLVHKMMKGDYSEEISIHTRDEHQELAEAFNRFQARLKQLRTDDRMAFLGRFSAVMAHELRKPLNITNIIVEEMLHNPELDREYCRQILREVDNADHFIEEILTFAKGDILEQESYSLSDLVSNELNRFKPLFTREKISVERSIEDTPEIYMDIQKMQQVLANILQNAVENLTGTDSRILRITLKHDKDDTELTIADSGGGFSEEALEHAFDPYFSQKEGGTGLGLAHCYRICSLHNADIQLRNTRENYGEVCITFSR